MSVRYCSHVWSKLLRPVNPHFRFQIPEVNRVLTADASIHAGFSVKAAFGVVETQLVKPKINPFSFPFMLPLYGRQEPSAYNGHFESTCYHPLLLLNREGDCLAAKLRPGNVHSAEGWDEQF